MQYNCEKCSKKFTSLNKYTLHINRKTPCNRNKIKIIIEHDDDDKSDITNTNNTLVKETLAFEFKKEDIIKPILKWVGGKTQILDKLISEFPTEINNYHEIFLGGGSVLITLLYYVKCGIIKLHGTIYAYDYNEPLIHIYKNIQHHHHHKELYNKVTQSRPSATLSYTLHITIILLLHLYHNDII